MIGIYKIISPKNRIYIGQSVSLESRILSYKYIRCYKQIRLYNSLLKYGYDNHTFEILEECDIENLNNRERYYQDLYNVLSKEGLNCVLTKSNDKSGRLSKQSILNRVASKKKNGKTISLETRIKMSKTRKGEKKKGKSVVNLDTNKIYNSIREAALDINMSKQTLTNMLNGRQKNKTNFSYHIKASQI